LKNQLVTRIFAVLLAIIVPFTSVDATGLLQPALQRPAPAHPIFHEQALVSTLTNFRQSPAITSIGRLFLKHQKWVSLATPLAFVAAAAVSNGEFESTFWRTVLWTGGLHGLYVSILWFIHGDRLKVNPVGVLCGVDGYDVSLSPQPTAVPLSRQPIPSELADVSLSQGAVTTKRGMHEAGAAIRVAYTEKGQLRYKLLVVKVVNPKRSYLPVLLEKAIQNTVAKERLRHKNVKFPPRFVVLKHFRYSTSSDPTIEEESHPHTGESPRLATVYTYVNGHRVKTQQDVQVVLGHNGDYDWVILPNGGKVAANENYKTEMIATLRNPDSPKQAHPNQKLGGDTPLFAMEVTLRRAQFDAYAAMRYARRMVVSPDERRSPPSPEKLTLWKNVFERVIDDSFPAARDLRTLTAQERLDLGRSMAQAFAHEAHQNPVFWEDHNTALIQPIVDEAIAAFLDNDLFKALHDAARSTGTSFGVGALSTLDHDPVFLSMGQGFSLARNRQKGLRAWNSESRALTVQKNGQWVYNERLDLDFSRGEVVRFREDGTTDIFPVQADRPLTPAESEARWFDQTKSAFTAPMPEMPKGVAPTKWDLDHVAYWLRESDRVWANPNSFNRMASANIEKRFLEMAKQGKGRVILTGMHTDLQQAEEWAEMMRERLPNVEFIIVPSNEILLEKDVFMRKYGQDPESTLVLAIDYFGARFPVGQTAIPWLTRFFPHVYAITSGVEGDLDNNVARTLGQKMHPGAPLAGNVITTSSPWPESQAESVTVTNLYSTLNYLALRIFTAQREAYPLGDRLDPQDGNKVLDPLQLNSSLTEIQAMWAAQRAPTQETALLTGVDAGLKPVPYSGYRKPILDVAGILHREFTEPRVARYAYRFIFLMGTLAFTLSTGFGPNSLFSGVNFQPIRFVLELTALVTYYAAGDKLVVFVMRAFQGRQLFSRLGNRKVGIASNTVWLFLEDYWNNLFGVSHPDATADVMGGDTVESSGNFFLKRVKPKLSRSSWVINFQSDDRLSALQTRVGASKMNGNQLKVEKSLPTWVRRLNTVLKIIGLRIPFAETQIISIGRHWPASKNAENYRLQLPMVAFPLPKPVHRFVESLEQGPNPIRLNGEQRGILWAELQKSDRAYTRGHEIAILMGLAESQRDQFAHDYRVADGSLYQISDADRAEHARLSRWMVARVHPMTDFIAGAVLGEEAARRTNNPTFAKHRRVPTGATQSGAFFDTTATVVSAESVMADMHLEQKLISQAIPLPDDVQTTVERTPVELAPGENPVLMYETAIRLPPRLEQNALPRAGIRLRDPKLNLMRDAQGTIRLPIWVELISRGGKDASLELVFTASGGYSYMLPVELTGHIHGSWKEIILTPEVLDQHNIPTDAVNRLDVLVVNGEGRFRIDANVADDVRPQMHQVARGSRGIQALPGQPTTMQLRAMVPPPVIPTPVPTTIPDAPVLSPADAATMQAIEDLFAPRKDTSLLLKKKSDRPAQSPLGGFWLTGEWTADRTEAFAYHDPDNLPLIEWLANSLDKRVDMRPATPPSAPVRIGIADLTHQAAFVQFVPPSEKYPYGHHTIFLDVDLVRDAMKGVSGARDVLSLLVLAEEFLHVAQEDKRPEMFGFSRRIVGPDRLEKENALFVLNLQRYLKRLPTSRRKAVLTYIQNHNTYDPENRLHAIYAAAHEAYGVKPEVENLDQYIFGILRSLMPLIQPYVSNSVAFLTGETAKNVPFVRLPAPPPPPVYVSPAPAAVPVVAAPAPVMETLPLSSPSGVHMQPIEPTSLSAAAVDRPVFQQEAPVPVGVRGNVFRAVFRLVVSVLAFVTFGMVVHAPKKATPARTPPPVVIPVRESPIPTVPLKTTEKSIASTPPPPAPKQVVPPVVPPPPVVAEDRPAPTETKTIRDGKRKFIGTRQELRRTLQRLRPMVAVAALRQISAQAKNASPDVRQAAAHFTTLFVTVEKLRGAEGDVSSAESAQMSILLETLGLPTAQAYAVLLKAFGPEAVKDLPNLDQIVVVKDELARAMPQAGTTRKAPTSGLYSAAGTAVMALLIVSQQLVSAPGPIASIPKVTSLILQSPAIVSMKIEWGMTLSGIAQSKGTTLARLLELNPQISNENLILAGNSLNVPGWLSQSLPVLFPSQSVSMNEVSLIDWTPLLNGLPYAAVIALGLGAAWLFYQLLARHSSLRGWKLHTALAGLVMVISPVLPSWAAVASFKDLVAGVGRSQESILLSKTRAEIAREDIWRSPAEKSPDLKLSDEDQKTVHDLKTRKRSQMIEAALIHESESRKISYLEKLLVAAQAYEAALQTAVRNNEMIPTELNHLYRVGDLTARIETAKAKARDARVDIAQAAGVSVESLEGLLPQQLTLDRVLAWSGEPTPEELALAKSIQSRLDADEAEKLAQFETALASISNLSTPARVMAQQIQQAEEKAQEALSQSAEAFDYAVYAIGADIFGKQDPRVTSYSRLSHPNPEALADQLFSEEALKADIQKENKKGPSAWKKILVAPIHWKIFKTSKVAKAAAVNHVREKQALNRQEFLVALKAELQRDRNQEAILALVHQVGGSAIPFRQMGFVVVPEVTPVVVAERAKVQASPELFAAQDLLQKIMGRIITDSADDQKHLNAFWKELHRNPVTRHIPAAWWPGLAAKVKPVMDASIVTSSDKTEAFWANLRYADMLVVANLEFHGEIEARTLTEVETTARRFWLDPATDTASKAYLRIADDYLTYYGTLARQALRPSLIGTPIGFKNVDDYYSHVFTNFRVKESYTWADYDRLSQFLEKMETLQNTPSSLERFRSMSAMVQIPAVDLLSISAMRYDREERVHKVKLSVDDLNSRFTLMEAIVRFEIKHGNTSSAINPFPHFDVAAELEREVLKDLRKAPAVKNRKERAARPNVNAYLVEQISRYTRQLNRQDSLTQQLIPLVSPTIKSIMNTVPLSLRKSPKPAATPVAMRRMV